MPMSASLLEELWDQEMHVIYADGIKHCGYRATYFLQMVSELGSLQTARILLKKEDISDGLTTLYLCGRLDLTMEARMFQRDEQGQRKWQALFTDEEFDIARARLVRLAYPAALAGTL